MISQNEVTAGQTSGEQNIRVTIDLARRTLHIDFHVLPPLPSKVRDLGLFRLQVKLDKMNDIFLKTEGSREIWTIPTDTPPELYKRTTSVEDTHQIGTRAWSEWNAWFRQTDVVLDPNQLRQEPTSMRKDQAIIDIGDCPHLIPCVMILILLGRWTTYTLAFTASNDPNSPLEQIKRVLSSYNIRFVKRDIEVKPWKAIEIWDLLDHTNIMSEVSSHEYSSQLEAVMAQEFFRFSFETRYQLEVCLTHGCLHEVNLSREFFRKLQDMDTHQRSRAVGLLEHVASLKRRFFNPMDIFGLRMTSLVVAGTREAPRHCVVTRSAVVTPTMVYFSTPALEISNRVVRNWPAVSDRFLRVRFSDELDQGQIRSGSNQRQDEVYARIKQVLRNGIVLGDRHYQFLAFGTSQFRERGAYFFAPTDMLSCQAMRDQLGQMSNADLKIPAKFCARLGQNFSTTRGLSFRVALKTHDPKDKKRLVLPDVKRNGFNFTDGVGKMSPYVAQMIANDLGITLKDPPTVVQFRLGGCKGVLALDPSLTRNELHLRPSQYKFAAIHDGLEIIRTSTFASASLNRQIILVLSALGVTDNVFLSKMKDQLMLLDNAMVNEEAAIAELEKFVDMNLTSLSLAGMVRKGFMHTREPFMMSMLRLWRSWMLKYLKEKAKLPISKGAFLLGTVDETATLQGHFDHLQLSNTDTLEERIKKLPEVFCFISPKAPGVYEAVTGVCILARNPSLHPGDIRVVRAVDKPKLHHIKNAVVFPQTGDRDVSNMCSGGDLDGDDYLLIWDEDLIPREWNHPPMDFTPAKPRTLDQPVTVNDMTDFFVEYMKMDQLAFIATRHLALSDYSDAGVKDSNCKKLAQLHSFAVDYPKSGVPVEVPAHLRKIKWPHFMEKPTRTYRSKKVLGQLYDLVVKEDFMPDYTDAFDSRIISAYQHDSELVRKIKLIKARYDAQVQKIMTQHGIDTEFEVWSAFVMKHNGTKKDYNFAEELGSLMTAVKWSFREECEKEAGGKDPVQLHPFVAAMYAVTATQVQKAVEQFSSGTKNEVNGSVAAINPKRMPFMSFPWLFMEELGKIAGGPDCEKEDSKRIKVDKKVHHNKMPAERHEGEGQVDVDEGSLMPGDILAPFQDQQASRSRGSSSEAGSVEAEEEFSREDLVTQVRASCPEETQFMSDEKVLSWWYDSDELDELQPQRKYEDLRVPVRKGVGIGIGMGYLNEEVQVHLNLDDDEEL